jgi:hypothetical protein
MKPKKCASADAYGKKVQLPTLNRRAAFCRFVVFSACVATGAFPLIGADDAPGLIICEGAHEGQLQGVDSQGTNIWWSFTRKIVKDIGQVFSQPRYFKIETDGLPEKVVTALNAAILSYSCPWSVTTCSKTEK